MNHSKTNLPFTNALALTGNADALREAHKQHIDITAPDWFGRTPLHLATLAGPRASRECLEVLLSLGADITARDHAGLTAEDWALESGNTQAVQLLQYWCQKSPNSKPEKLGKSWWPFSKNHNPQLHSQTGFTLIELMIVLAIFTIAGGAVYALFFSGQGTGDIVRAQAETSALSSALVGAYATRANFVDLTNESASQEGWLPKTMANGSGGPVNIWSRPITLSSVDLDVAGDRMGAAIQQDIPAKTCALFIASVASGFDFVSVNDHRFIPTDAQNPDTLAGPCGDAGDTAHVSLVRRHP